MMQTAFLRKSSAPGGKTGQREDDTFRDMRLIFLLLLPVLIAAGCEGTYGEREAMAERLSEIVVETREKEFEAITRKESPDFSDPLEKFIALGDSLQHVHSTLEEDLEYYDNHIPELVRETEALSRKIEALRRDHVDRFATLDEAWTRYWRVTQELNRTRSLAWRDE